jgi:hypothetical protein
MELYQGLALGVVVGALAAVAVLAVMAGGKLGLGLKVGKRAGSDAGFATKLNDLLAAKPVEPKPAKPSGAPLRLLALLQREGRLLDFLLEDLKSYQDAQVGAAVRDIHQKCQATVKEHLVLQPVLPQSEGSTVTVPPGFDPSAVRLTGNVTGQPPFTGVLQHPGWRVAELKIASPPEGQDEFVLMPAEVEIP